jgi:diadenosine tetraphosphate (Ap4A) HIT family hydrolase
MTRRRPFDVDAYIRRSQSGACFICEIVAGNPDYHHCVVYEDDVVIAFLNKYPTLYGYTLVAPRQHREHVTGDFSLDEYLHLQSVIYRVAEAVRQVVPTERLYILSLGSQQGNRHVHWHIAPLPPGVPYAEQQLEALSFKNGILTLSDAEMAALAARMREALGQKGDTVGGMAQ